MKLEAKVLKMYGVASSTKKSQIKGKKQLEDVTSSVDYITKKFDEYEEERKKKDEQIKMFARVCVFSGKQKRWEQREMNMVFVMYGQSMERSYTR